VRFSPPRGRGRLSIGKILDDMDCFDWRLKTSGFTSERVRVGTMGMVKGPGDIQKLGDFPTGGMVKSSPTIDREGRVWVGSWDKKVYVLKYEKRQNKKTRRVSNRG